MGSATGSVVSEQPDLWRPDAVVVVNTDGGTTVEVSQHTEGRYEQSMAMLDISVTELDEVSDTVGGWLGVDGSAMAGQAPAECAVHRPARLLSNQEQKRGSRAKFVSDRWVDRLSDRQRQTTRVRGCPSVPRSVCLDL